MTPPDPRWTLALRAAALLAVDPIGLGGVVLRGAASPARDAWLAALRAVLPAETPWRRMPPQIAEGRLLGGLDLAATLAAGRPIAERGLLVEVDSGLLLVPMAERLAGTAAGHLCAAIDTGAVVLERDGIAARLPARFAAIVLDEGIDDERVSPALAERLAFSLNLDGVRPAPAPSTMLRMVPLPHFMGEDESEAMPRASSPVEDGGGGPKAVEGAANAEEIATARSHLPAVVASDDVIEALAVAGLAFGVPSLRVATLALRAAKAAAALAGRDVVSAEDAEIAAALVIAPRATQLPTADAEDEMQAAEEPPPPPESEPSNEEAATPEADAQTMADSVVEATRAAIPADLLAVLGAAAGAPRQAAASGRAGIARQSAKRGRPAGVRRGAPGHGVRLAVVDTLRAAAPWQRLRRKTSASPPPCGEGQGVGVRAEPRRLEPAERTPIPNPSPQGGRERVLVRREDFRVGRFKEKSETLTIFAVDASGSAALHRLAEVKGAVELILADCYVRRDAVALIAFRGDRAELILPPTRSLARAKRALAGQPGGGGTPLAAAIDAASLLAQAARRKGQTPLVVLLTDGKANIARTGLPGRAEAEADAQAAAQAFRLGGASGLVLDIAPRPGEAAARLATAMGARYVPLPYADAHVMSRAVLAAGAG